MEMLLHNTDVNGKWARLVTVICDKAQKAKGVKASHPRDSVLHQDQATRYCNCTWSRGFIGHDILG